MAAYAALHPAQLRALHVSALYANKRGDDAATRELLADLTRALHHALANGQTARREPLPSNGGSRPVLLCDSEHSV